MLIPRIKKLILIRLLFGVLLLYAPRLFLAETPVAFYAAAILICVLTVPYMVWYLTRWRMKWLAFTQIFIDILLETYLVLYSGGAESAFTVLYVVSILSAAFVLAGKKSILAATVLSGIGYSLASVIAYKQGMSSLIPRDGIYFYYGTAMRIGVFLAVGYLSHYLSESILELQAKLRLSERLSTLGEVVSKIAHEVRNPLGAIRTAAEVLKETMGGTLTPQNEKLLSVVDGESDRLTKTLQRILNYTKQVSLDKKSLLLDNVLERVLAMAALKSDLHPERVTVEKYYNKEKTHVYADEEQLIGALLNLTQNAYQAMSEKGGLYKINAQEEFAGTKIDLEDRGGGIPREKIKELFTPFKSFKKGGTGLGLAEVHKIVTMHDGKIEVEVSEGKGTIFHLYFPKG